MGMAHHGNKWGLVLLRWAPASIWLPRSAEARLRAQNKWREQTHCAIFKLLPNGVISRQWFFKPTHSSKTRPLLHQTARAESPEQNCDVTEENADTNFKLQMIFQFLGFSNSQKSLKGLGSTNPCPNPHFEVVLFNCLCAKWKAGKFSSNGCFAWEIKGRRLEFGARNCQGNHPWQLHWCQDEDRHNHSPLVQLWGSARACGG